MPLNSVQLYVHSLLDGITVPGAPGQPSSTLTAWISPPTLEDLDGPRAYVWGGRMRGRRQTAPRITNNDPSTAGFKRLDYTMDIYLTYLTNPDDAQVSQEFPLLIDTVLQVLWRTPMDVFIDDQGQVTTTAQYPTASQIVSIGEEWDLEYPPERTPATMRMLYYSCRIGMDITELVQS